MDKDDVVKGLIAERTALTDYLRGPSAPAEDAGTLCEGWTVRDVVAHLVGNCADVVAGRLEGVGSEAYNQRQIDERAGRTLAEILDEWDTAGPAAEAFYQGLTPEFWAAELPGMGTVGLGVTRHLYDLWTHTNDILIPQGAQAAPGLGARATLDVLSLELPRRLRKTMPTVGSLSLAFDEAKEQFAIGDGEEVQVSGDLNTFLMLCVGRVDAEAASRVTFSPTPPGDVVAAFDIYAGR